MNKPRKEQAAFNVDPETHRIIMEASKKSQLSIREIMKFFASKIESGEISFSIPVKSIITLNGENNG
ncbi:hypothetical protein H8E88_19385 [candidate division KSB1 bacterium]|nr:hypothetical protein [candidate division KSB1 bacterium]